MEITSKDNDMIKNIRKLKEKKFREEENKFIIEGIKIVEEAINEKANIDTIILCEEMFDKNENNSKKELLENKIKNIKIINVNKDVFISISNVENPQGILAIINKKEEKEIDYNEDIIIALDDINDPGNLGTILRTIDSCNLKQVLISKNTVDPFNEKVIRSTMGAIFRINIIKCDLKEKLKEVKNNNFTILATTMNKNKTIYDVKYDKKVIVIGNEANGVSKEIIEIADEKISIPMLGKTESLNASVATGITLYEYVRQKLKKIYLK